MIQGELDLTCSSLNLGEFGMILTRGITPLPGPTRLSHQDVFATQFAWDTALKLTAKTRADRVKAANAVFAQILGLTESYEVCIDTTYRCYLQSVQFTVYSTKNIYIHIYIYI